jgi:lysophospholipase L1-like esterase
MARERRSKFANDAKTAADIASQLAQKANISKNSIGWVGDSHTALQSSLPTEGGNEYVYYSGFLHVANARLHQRLNIVGTRATSGYTTTMILNAGYVDQMIELAPTFCGVLAGTNDVADYSTAETIMEKLKVIYNKLLGKGMYVIAATIPPNNNSDLTQKQIRAKLNTLIKRYAFETPNVYLYDLARYVSAVDGDTFLTGCTDDNIHLNNTGGHYAGIGLADMLEPLIVPYNNFVCSNNDPTNLLPNALFTSGTNLATGWGEWPPSGVGPIVSRTDGQTGKWEQITIGAEDVYFTADITTGYTIGDTVRSSVEFEFDNANVGVDKISLYIYCETSGQKTICNYHDIIDSNHSGVLQTPDLVIPTGTTKLTLTILVQGVTGGRVRFARPKLERV